jgi:hypothetical protein
MGCRSNGWMVETNAIAVAIATGEQDAMTDFSPEPQCSDARNIYDVDFETRVCEDTKTVVGFTSFVFGWSIKDGMLRGVLKGGSGTLVMTVAPGSRLG